jgi:GNAT superfamily N-acetyltransferase
VPGTDPASPTAPTQARSTAPVFDPAQDPVRRLGPDLRERAVTAVVAAFATDPVLRWVWPEDERYDVCAPDFFRLLVDLRTRAGEVWVAGDGASVAMWDPPGGLYLPTAEGVWAAARSGFRQEERDRWTTYDTLMAVPGDAGPHWYLGVLATDPAAQGRGLGRAVLGPVLAAADRTGLPCYLETATESNVRFYEGSGFRPVMDVVMPEGPRVWLMRRDSPPAVTRRGG